MAIANITNNILTDSGVATSSLQPTISLTTTGTSGAATFSANTLNIPNYGSALSGYLPLTGGTLTGALTGTSASFSSTATATAFIPSGATVPTNGMYLSAANTLNFATASTNRLSISSTGVATFSSTLGINGTSDNIKSGTYTPTLTNYYNISSSSFDAYTSTKYVRIGNNVTVTGLVNITPTTAASYVILYLSLPIASTNTDQGTLVGSTETDEVVFGGVLQTSSVCILQFNNVTNNSRYVYYTFTYIIS
jgi:hypothetical protein